MSATIVQQAFAQATALHAAGDLARAEACYRQVLAAAPNHPDALHLLGRLACDAGQPQAALNLIRAAIAQRPRIAEYQASLGDAQRALGQAGEAAETYRRAARLKPESPQIQFGHGLALMQDGQSALAIQAFRRALARDPRLLQAHNALGAALLAAGDATGAAEAFRAAMRIAPGDADAVFNLGCALRATADLSGAEQAFRNAVILRPSHVPAWGNLGLALQASGLLQEAEEALERVVALEPGSAQGWLNLGLVQRARSRFAAAEASFRRAHAIAPSADALCCLGNALRDQAAADLAKLDEAEQVLQEVLERAPDHREGHVALGVTRLLRGDLAAGWPDFAWRPAAELGRARVPGRLWQGQALAGTLLIHAEQGAGDFIQFCRYVAMAAALTQRVVLLVPHTLYRLALTIEGAAAVLVPGDSLPDFAAVCTDMDLPGIFGTSLETIPSGVPYLAASAQDTAHWRARLAALPGSRHVGVAWAGNQAYFHDAQRSIPMATLAALQDVPDVSFVSLQPSQPGAALWMADFTSELTDFAATAALVEALDLVISVDSAVAHLAGALGRPVWLLNRFAPDWRWQLKRTDSPWYPGMMQFRQPAPADWAGVVSSVRSALL